MPANLKQLTSLRFFAAAWVVAYHYWPQLTGGRPPFVDRGYLGVELFFVLSGFILSHVYLDAAGPARLNYGAFLWARLARIYPVHLATLAAIGVMGAAALAMGCRIEHPVLVWSALPQNLALVHAWGTVSVAGWNHPSWSISAEWFAYLTFPAFAWAAWRLRARPWAAVGLASALILSLYPAFEAMAGFSLAHATAAWGALRIVPCFALGCAVNLLWRAEVLNSAKPALTTSLAAFGAVVVASLLGAPDLVLVLLFGALIFGLGMMASAGSSVLTGATLVYLGEVSFAVYMVCIPWQLAFSKAVGRLFAMTGDTLPTWLWLVEIAGVVPVAMLVHHLVERPARSWMRRHDPFGEPAFAPTPAAVGGT